jgi:hypothetical protein
MIDWINTAQAVTPIVAAIFGTVVACWNLGLAHHPPLRRSTHRQIEAPEQFNRDRQRLVLDPARWSAHPLDTLWPETGMAS